MGDEAELEYEHNALLLECEGALSQAALVFAASPCEAKMSHATVAALAATGWNGQLSDDLLSEWASWPAENTAVLDNPGHSGPAALERGHAHGEEARLRQRLARLDAQRSASEHRAVALNRQLERLATVLSSSSSDATSAHDMSVQLGANLEQLVQLVGDGRGRKLMSASPWSVVPTAEVQPERLSVDGQCVPLPRGAGPVRCQQLPSSGVEEVNSQLQRAALALGSRHLSGSAPSAVSTASPAALFLGEPETESITDTDAQLQSDAAPSSCLVTPAAVGDMPLSGEAATAALHKATTAAKNG